MTNLVSDGFESMKATVELQNSLIAELQRQLDAKREQVDRLLNLAEQMGALIDFLRERK